MANRNEPYMNELASMLNDAILDRVMAMDRNLDIIAWNKPSENITGICKKDALGKNVMEIFPRLKQDEEIVRAIEMALDGKTSLLPARAGLFNRDHYENQFMPLIDGEGNVIGVMNLMHDVAHRIKAEKKLQKLNTALQQKYKQVEKLNADLSTFTSITGNELKEPIRKVYTSLEMLVKNDAARLSDSSKAGLRRMQASLNRINLLLDDILALSTVSHFSIDFTPVDLNIVLQETCKALRGKIEESQAVIDAEPLPVVNGSREMLYYLFYNLLDNALKFQEAGHIPQIKINAAFKTAADETEYHCISVIDNGIGFDQADAERIFNMFERLHERKRFHGSGIGLTICRKIAEAHGGYIEVQSEPGKGSIFHCCLSMTPELREATLSTDSLFAAPPRLTTSHRRNYHSDT